MAKKNRGGQQQNDKVTESMRTRIAQLLSRFNSADDEGEVFEQSHGLNWVLMKFNTLMRSESMFASFLFCPEEGFRDLLGI